MLYRFDSYAWCECGASPYIRCGRAAPEYAGVTVCPAEIIKMLALVGCITVWQKSNDELTINRSNAGNRTEKVNSVA